MTSLEDKLTQENEALHQENHRLTLEVKMLREKIDLLIRKVFGASSEKLDPAQLELLLGELDSKKAEASSCAAAALEADNARVAQKLRKPRPEHELCEEMLQKLPTIDVVLEPEEVTANPAAWRYINADEVTRQLDYEPARYVCRRIIRRRYVKHEDPYQPPVIAPLPTLLERSIAGPGVLAAILVSKYCDHLPLYRQEQIAWTRFQVHLSRQTMARWVGLAAQWLLPIYRMIVGRVFETRYVQVDETVIKYLKPGSGKAQTGYLWSVQQPGGDGFFHWEISRAAVCLERIIPVDFSGTIQCDGYKAYPAFVRQHEQALTLAGCWAHVRRKFFESTESAPMQAALILRQIQGLYLVESTLRERNVGPGLRQAIRSAQSRPIMERISEMLTAWKKSGKYLPSSNMGKAIDYALRLWPALQVYLEDGQIEIDNNLVENAIRPTAIGKKNWLFIGEAGAGQRSAIIFTIIEACRRREINPFDYLRDVFTRMPSMAASEYGTLTPENWSKAQKAKANQTQKDTIEVTSCAA